MVNAVICRSPAVLVSLLLIATTLILVPATLALDDDTAQAAIGASKSTKHNIVDLSTKEHDKNVADLLQANHDEDKILVEEEEYWERMMQNLNSIPTRAPIVPPSPQPTNCPTRVEVECGDCQSLGEDCIKDVDMVHKITNNGNEVERVYELTAIRNGKAVNLFDLIPENAKDIQPGQTLVVTETVEINRCEGETFETETRVITGPPCEVEVKISCVSDEGEECKSIAPPDIVEDCFTDVTYSYKVDNIGDVDANIITFERTRNEQFRDLMPLLDTTFLEVGASTTVEETDGIDVCSGGTYSTKVLVQQVPNADLLCEDVGFYEYPN